MPGGDRTGPAETGPMAGRAAGYCPGYPLPGYANWAPGCGVWGWGRGGGRGWRHWFHATGLTGWQRAGRGWPAPASWAFCQPLSKDQQLELLQGQAERLRQALDEVSERITKLQSQSEED